MTIPSSAKVVIIGGGICGASLAYHLAKEGCTDTLLIEKGELTSGSTWHAAGQVTHSVSSYTLANFRKYACELYGGLEAESGVATSWHKSGSLRVAYEPVEVDCLKSQLGVADYVGNRMEWVGPDAIAALHPFYVVDDIIGAVYTPDDGHVDPSGATNAMMTVARGKGVGVSRRNRVLGIERLRGGAFEVATEQGKVRAEHVVNAAGCYAHQVGQMVGLSVPMANALHTYLITDAVEEFAGLGRELPVMRDDYVSGYVRQEQQSGLIGIYEQHNAEGAWASDGGPSWALENPLFPADFDRIGFWLERAFERVPILEPLGIKQVIRGAIAHTPDGEPMLGPSGIPNFWMMAGVQVGIADGPGLGRELARWMVHGETEVSVRAYDARRFGFLADADVEHYGQTKGLEDYEFRHQTPLPGLEHPRLRPYRKTPLYERLEGKGAVFTQVYGWERPKWYPTLVGLPQEDVVAFRHTDWFEEVTQECVAVRERVGLLDSTAFAKFDLIGRDAAEVLDGLTTNTLTEVGRIGLSYFLTQTGRIEGEATITRLSDDHFYIVSAAVGEQKDVEFFETHWPNEVSGGVSREVSEGLSGGVSGIDSREVSGGITGSVPRDIQGGLPGGITGGVSGGKSGGVSGGVLRGAGAELRVCSQDIGVIAVVGPLARKLLARCTDADLRNKAFPWLSAAFIDVAGCEVRALRVSFVGELGWELHAPTEDLGTIYDALWDAGTDLGIANIGNHALDSLRMEKQYMVSRDLTHDVGPDEAGLDRFVKVSKGSFVGRDALLARRASAEAGERPYRWKLAYLEIDSHDADVHGSDGIYCCGEPVGLITSGAYGHYVKRGLGFAYLSPEFAKVGTKLEVRVVGEPRPARVLGEPAYDPTSARLRM